MHHRGERCLWVPFPSAIKFAEKRMKQPYRCRRCGECCRLGGPSLTARDVTLVREGHFSPRHLCTLRAGEWIRDDEAGRALTGATPSGTPGFLSLTREAVKLRGYGHAAHPWQCLFFAVRDGQGTCTVYEARPEQCRALFCGDTVPLLELLRDVLADRRSLLQCLPLSASDVALRLELMEAHDELCPAAGYAALQRRTRLAYSPEKPTADVAAARKEAQRAMEEMRRRDDAFRALCVNRGAVSAEELPFLLGQALRSLPMPDGAS